MYRVLIVVSLRFRSNQRNRKSPRRPCDNKRHHGAACLWWMVPVGSIIVMLAQSVPSKHKGTEAASTCVRLLFCQICRQKRWVSSLLSPILLVFVVEKQNHRTPQYEHAAEERKQRSICLNYKSKFHQVHNNSTFHNQTIKFHQFLRIGGAHFLMSFAKNKKNSPLNETRFSQGQISNRPAVRCIFFSNQSSTCASAGELQSAVDLFVTNWCLCLSRRDRATRGSADNDEKRNSFRFGHTLFCKKDCNYDWMRSLLPFNHNFLLKVIHFISVVVRGIVES